MRLLGVGNWVKNASSSSFLCCGWDRKHFLTQPDCLQSLNRPDKLEGYTVPFRLTGANACANPRCSSEVVNFDWRPQGCSLVPFSASGFCQLLGERNLVFIGDSIVSQHYSVMIGSIEHDARREFGTPLPPWVLPCLSSLKIFISDTLIGESLGHMNRGKSLASIVELNTTNGDVVMAGVGPHIRSANDSVALAHFRRVAASVHDTMQNKFGNRLFFWLSSLPGHFQTCMNTRQSGSPFSTWPEALKSISTPTAYGHHLFPKFNRIAEQIFGPTNFVPVWRPLAFRRDGHIPARHDCLHWCLPGAIGKLVPPFLYHALRQYQHQQSSE